MVVRLRSGGGGSRYGLPGAAVLQLGNAATESSSPRGSRPANSLRFMPRSLPAWPGVGGICRGRRGQVVTRNPSHVQTGSVAAGERSPCRIECSLPGWNGQADAFLIKVSLAFEV